VSECIDCGYELGPEEMESPRKDADGDLVCDDCWSNEHEFECVFCGNFDDKEHDHKMLMLCEEQKAHGYAEQVMAGVYRVTSYPYFISDYFSAWLLPERLERVADCPEKADTSGAICLGC